MQDRILSLLPRVTTPGQYLGLEWNSHRGAGDAPARTSIALAVPETYAHGLHDLTLQTLYGTLNARPGVNAERVFLPLGDMEGVMRRTGLGAFTLESRRSPRDFDWILLVLSDELAYPGVLRLLDLAGIPLASDERGPGDPLVLATGAGAKSAEALARFVDLFLPGEPDEEIHAWLDTFEQFRDELEDRPALIEAMVRTLGTAYAPSLYDPASETSALRPLREGLPETIAMTWVADLDRTPVADRPLVGYVQTDDERVAVELQRGGDIDEEAEPVADGTPPPRRRSGSRVVEIANEIYANTGFGRIHLHGSHRSKHPELEAVIRQLAKRYTPHHVAITLDPLPVAAWTRGAIRALAQTYRPVATLDIDGGSERLRDEIGRPATNKDVHDLVIEAIHARLTRLDLSFRIGLPAETDHDLDALAALVRDCVALRRRNGADSPLKVQARVGYFAPRPFTTGQCEGMFPLEELRRRAQRVTAAAGADASRIFFDETPERGAVRCAIARGGRELGAAIRHAFESGLRSETSDADAFAIWSEALERAGRPLEKSLRPLESPPWRHFVWAVEDEQSATRLAPSLRSRSGRALQT